MTGFLPCAVEHVEICRHPWRGFYIPHPTWMGRTTWFQKNQYASPGPYCCEDQELLLRTYATNCFHVLPEALLAYRIRSHAPWKKLLHTRGAWLRMQVRQFWKQRAIGLATLSVTAYLARVASDARHKIFSSPWPAKSGWGISCPPTDSERACWAKIIADIQQQAKNCRTKR